MKIQTTHNLTAKAPAGTLYAVPAGTMCSLVHDYGGDIVCKITNPNTQVPFERKALLGLEVSITDEFIVLLDNGQKWEFETDYSDYGEGYWIATRLTDDSTINAREYRLPHVRIGAGTVSDLLHKLQAASKLPSFRALKGRAPIRGEDYDPNAAMCQDDYEYFTGTGRYNDHAEVPNG